MKQRRIYYLSWLSNIFVSLTKYFNEIEIAYKSQRKYAMNLHKEIEMLGSKSIETSIIPNKKYSSDMNSALEEANRYRCFVGKLIYLTITGSNIV